MLRPRPGQVPLVWSLKALVRAADSNLSLSRRRKAPLLRNRAIPLALRSSYISCGRQRWIAAGSDWTLTCARELPKRRR
jgi:hypothetical protein